MFIDLDGLKQINDSKDHASGDLALQHIATRLGNTSRDADIVGRRSGDEFVVLLDGIFDPDTSSEVAMRVAKRLIDTTRIPLEVVGTAFEVSASVGIAIYPECASNIESLIHHADAAMYLAKANGAGEVVQWSAS